MLPQYSANEDLTRSLTDLLGENGSTLSARAANMILMDLGILEELERSSTGGRKKHFKSLTKFGQKFGRNETAPENPNQTHPRYYVETFSELMELARRGVAA